MKQSKNDGTTTIPNPLSINKTLKANLPTRIEQGKDEIHFTEDGGIYISDKDGKLVSCGSSEIDPIIKNQIEQNKLDIASIKEELGIIGSIADSIINILG